LRVEQSSCYEQFLGGGYLKDTLKGIEGERERERRKKLVQRRRRYQNHGPNITARWHDGLLVLELLFSEPYRTLTIATILPYIVPPSSQYKIHAHSPKQPSPSPNYLPSTPRRLLNPFFHHELPAGPFPSFAASSPYSPLLLNASRAFLFASPSHPILF
jgi:hypothetical protein